MQRKRILSLSFEGGGMVCCRRSFSGLFGQPAFLSCLWMTGEEEVHDTWVFWEVFFDTVSGIRLQQFDSNMVRRWRYQSIGARR